VHADGADGETLRAEVEVALVAAGALGVEIEQGRAEIPAEARALADEVDHAAGAAGAVEEGLRAVDVFGGLKGEAVERGALGEKKTLAALVGGFEAAHAEVGEVGVVARLEAAVGLVAALMRFGEAGVFREHFGEVNDTHVLHEILVEDVRRERDAVEREVGAGDGVGARGFVAAVARRAGDDIEGREHDDFVVNLGAGIGRERCGAVGGGIRKRERREKHRHHRRRENGAKRNGTKTARVRPC
jgi:hypothetical protein